MPAKSPNNPPVTTGVQPINLLTSRQAAARLSVSLCTVDRLIRKGVLRLHRIGPRGPRRFRIEDVDRVLISNQTPEQRDDDLDSFITNNIKKD